MFSITQAGNLIKLISAILVLIGARPFSEEETNALLIVLGMVGEFSGFMMSWIGRWRLGDINILGARRESKS
mgnify:CR=1 FL=1